MSFRFSSDVLPPRSKPGTPTGWAWVVVAALLPFTTAYILVGINPDVDVEFIAALVGLFILVAAVVANVASSVVNKLRHSASNDHWVY